MSTRHESESPEPDSMTVDPANLGSVDPLSVEGLFLAALSRAGIERENFLSAQCVDQLQRVRLEALLVACEKAGDFLQKPAEGNPGTQHFAFLPVLFCLLETCGLVYRPAEGAGLHSQPDSPANHN